METDGTYRFEYGDGMREVRQDRFARYMRRRPGIDVHVSQIDTDLGWKRGQAAHAAKKFTKSHPHSAIRRVDRGTYRYCSVATDHCLLSDTEVEMESTGEDEATDENLPNPEDTLTALYREERQSAFVTTAVTLHALFEAYVDAGFTEAQALALVRSSIETVVSS